MNLLAWTVFVILFYSPAFSGTVGTSHNATDAIGRNRANVFYNPAKVATKTQINPITVVDTAQNLVDTIEPAPEPAPIPEQEPDLSNDIAMATEYLAQLQTEIHKIDAEIIRCKNAKRNWTIGTVVGSAGVIGTATGAIIQAIQINKAKKNGATDADNTSDNAEDAQ